MNFWSLDALFPLLAFAAGTAGLLFPRFMESYFARREPSAPLLQIYERMRERAFISVGLIVLSLVLFMQELFLS